MARPLLFVIALRVETQGRLEAAGARLLFTGAGKVNAAYALICCALPFRFGAYMIASGVGGSIFNLAVDSVPLTIGLLLCGRWGHRRADPTVPRTRATRLVATPTASARGHASRG